MRRAMELRIRSLSKTYANGVRALKDVTLTIPRGMYGLLGPNGAGKSTLMRTIATLQEPDAGEIRLGPIDVLAERERVRETLGYLPQEFGVYPRASAEELLDHFAVLKGITVRGERRAVVDALLRQVNLHEVRRTRSFSRRTSMPAPSGRVSVIEPVSGSWSVAMVRISVDLPAPLGPSSPYIPTGMSSVMSWRARTPLA